MFLGTTVGGYRVGIPLDKAMRLWMGLLPQAGVSLGLAGIIGEQFAHTWGSDFQSTMVGIILVNQIIGPVGAKFLIKYCQEDNRGGGGHEGPDGLKKMIEAMHDGHTERAKEPVTIGNLFSINDLFLNRLALFKMKLSFYCRDANRR